MIQECNSGEKTNDLEKTKTLLRKSNGKRPVAISEEIKMDIEIGEVCATKKPKSDNLRIKEKTERCLMKIRDMK